jgi:hypothetical protein
MGVSEGERWVWWSRLSGVRRLRARSVRWARATVLDDAATSHSDADGVGGAGLGGAVDEADRQQRRVRACRGSRLR